RRSSPVTVVRVLPDRVARGDHGHFDSIAVLHPEDLAGARFIGQILKGKNREEPVGLSCKDLARLASVNRLALRKIETDHDGVRLLHQGPGALGVPCEDFPTIRALKCKMIRVEISPTPFYEAFIWRACRN